MSLQFLFFESDISMNAPNTSNDSYQLPQNKGSSSPVLKNSRALITCGVLGSGLFAINLILGGSLVYATGIPGLSAIVSGLFVPLVLSLSAFLTKTPRAPMVVWIVYSILAIPTVLNGPPGIYKVFIGIVAGFFYYLPITLLRGRLIGHYIGLFTYTVVNLSAFWLAFDILQLPGADAFKQAVFVVATIFFIEGTISITIAHYWYSRRLSKLPFLESLSSR